MKIILATLLASTIALPATAQTIVAAPTGPRIELRVGWDRPVVTGEVTDDGVTYSENAGKSGVTYGGEIGYDVPLGAFATIGAYAGVEGASTKACGPLFGGDALCLRAGRNVTAGARLGYLFAPNGLLYGKVGYSNGRVRLTYDDPATPAARFDEGTNRDGFHLGAGAELGFSRNVYGKVEYVYTNYNGYALTDGTTGAKLDADRHQVVAGVGLRF